MNELSLFQHWDRLHTSCKYDAFYGPNSWYLDAIGRVAGEPSLLPARITRQQLCEASRDDRLTEFANLRLAENYTINPLIKLLSAPKLTSSETLQLEPQVDELDWYRKVSECLDRLCRPAVERWSVAYWRTLTFVLDRLNQSGVPPVGTVQEETPLLFGSTKEKRIIKLVAECLPGPPIVTPHWPRIGLVPLGRDEELSKQIQSAMQKVLWLQKFRFQIRWWLDSYHKGRSWHDENMLEVDFGASPSIQAAAACLVLALGEKTTIRPVLDPMAAVSATCDEGRDIGDVGYLEAKIKACHEAGLHCLVLTQEMVQRYKDFAEQHAPGLQLLAATKLTDAYEILQSTSPVLKSIKQTKVHEWQKQFKPTHTDQVYIDASK
ncbi:MAG: hypothetical protein JNL67_07535 [Planctomycetaceae bacterium]|nr:hypothetical protein [Planctomycetaceae bacterium]